MVTSRLPSSKGSLLGSTGLTSAHNPKNDLLPCSQAPGPVCHFQFLLLRGNIKETSGKGPQIHRGSTHGSWRGSWTQPMLSWAPGKQAPSLCKWDIAVPPSPRWLSLRSLFPDTMLRQHWIYVGKHKEKSTFLTSSWWILLKTKVPELCNCVSKKGAVLCSGCACYQLFSHVFHWTKFHHVPMVGSGPG